MLGDQCFKNLAKASFAAAALDVGADVVVAAPRPAMLKTAGGGYGGTNTGMDVVVVATEIASTALLKTAENGGTNMDVDVVVVVAEITSMGTDEIASTAPCIRKAPKSGRSPRLRNLGWLMQDP